MVLCNVSEIISKYHSHKQWRYLHVYVIDVSKSALAKEAEALLELCERPTEILSFLQRLLSKTDSLNPDTQVFLLDADALYNIGNCAYEFNVESDSWLFLGINLWNKSVELGSFEADMNLTWQETIATGKLSLACSAIGGLRISDAILVKQISFKLTSASIHGESLGICSAQGSMNFILVKHPC